MRIYYRDLSMKKMFLLLIGLTGANLTAYCQELSPDAQVSVLTVAPGHEELYAAFGHSAIRIEDPKTGLDKVYNYGTYYYNQPHFYLNFARGYLLYGLSVSNYNRFKTYYRYFNRIVTAQYLQINHTQKQAIFDFLEKNALPENSKYYYDYFYDNCATRIRDVFIEVLGKDLQIPEKYTSNPGATIRQLTDFYIEEPFPWGKLGIDLCLGLPMDKQLTDFEYMYLPDYLYQGMAATKLKTDSTSIPLVAKTKVILSNRPMEYATPWFTPMVAFSLLFVLGLLFLVIQLKGGSSFRWFDFILFLAIGAIGLFLFLLWVATDHQAAAQNFNLLWAIPTHLVLAFTLLRKKVSYWANWYVALLIPISVIVLIFWKFFPQDLNEGFIPIVFLVIVRSFAILKR